MGESEVRLLSESVLGWRFFRRLASEHVAIVKVRVFDGCLSICDRCFMRCFHVIYDFEVVMRRES